MKHILSLAFVAAIAAAGPALAQDAQQPPSNDQLAAQFGGDSITVAAAGVYLPDYEGSNNYRITGAPAVIGTFKGFNFTVLGNRASIDLIPNRPNQTIDLQAGPIGVINFNRTSTDSIDDRRVRSLGEVGTAIELGGYIGIGKSGVITSPYDKLSVSVSYRHDVSNVHDSGLWQPSINYLTPLSRKAAVGVFASATHAGAGYARTYFSVSTLQSIASTLPIYNAHSGWTDYTLGGFSTYSLTGNLLHGFKVIAGGTYSRELNSASYSPLTRIAGSPNQWLGAVGLAYTF